MSLTLDAAGLIDAFSTGSYTVTRRTAATRLKGRPVAGATSTVTITAAVVPATGQDLQRVPEGRRDVETRVLFTATQLRTGAAGAAWEADLVQLEGLQWEVQHVETWPGAPGFYRCIAQRP